MNINESMYYSNEELKMLGVLSCGKNACISRKTSIYSGGGRLSENLK